MFLNMLGRRIMTRRLVALSLAMLFPLARDAAAQASAAPIVGVESFMERPDRHAGPVRVRGVVWKVLPDKGLFSLVDMSDREELLATGKTQCVSLPLLWTKTPPEPHAVLVV
ncbi:MAG: hypothetical protein K8I02_03205, partial [Candidatus Methylomirabilis sp.]|nr:hypothetical protein [Deltaproteobacteria bacterium]